MGLAKAMQQRNESFKELDLIKKRKELWQENVKIIQEATKLGGIKVVERQVNYAFVMTVGISKEKIESIGLKVTELEGGILRFTVTDRLEKLKGILA